MISKSVIAIMIGARPRRIVMTILGNRISSAETAETTAISSRQIPETMAVANQPPISEAMLVAASVNSDISVSMAEAKPPVIVGPAKPLPLAARMPPAAASMDFWIASATAQNWVQFQAKMPISASLIISIRQCPQAMGRNCTIMLMPTRATASTAM